ncbi:transporter, partial [Candidatus Woesearchaeota archaeon]|nr:transporter [Candidatus Woesearchaeota archaeon]
FRQMPELYWVYGYPFAIGLMLLSVLMLYILFKLKKWI